MGTRAVIKVEGLRGVGVYKHWDGMPESTKPWLKKFNENFVKERGDDPQYKFAQLLRSSAFDCEEFELDPSKVTGWGVILINGDNKIPWDVEYVYTLKKDGKVTVSGNTRK